MKVASCQPNPLYDIPGNRLLDEEGVYCSEGLSSRLIVVKSNNPQAGRVALCLKNGELSVAFSGTHPADSAFRYHRIPNASVCLEIKEST